MRTSDKILHKRNKKQCRVTTPVQGYTFQVGRNSDGANAAMKVQKVPVVYLHARFRRVFSHLLRPILLFALLDVLHGDSLGHRLGHNGGGRDRNGCRGLGSFLCCRLRGQFL